MLNPINYNVRGRCTHTAGAFAGGAFAGGAFAGGAFAGVTGGAFAGSAFPQALVYACMLQCFVSPTVMLSVLLHARPPPRGHTYPICAAAAFAGNAFAGIC
jgi:hypothetical protein